MVSQAGALLLGAAIAASSGFSALIGVLFGFSLKCDDSCRTPPGWRENPDAWQWEAFGWVAVAGSRFRSSSWPVWCYGGRGSRLRIWLSEACSAACT